MKKRPNVFVGTLYSNEGDFDVCCEMVRVQSSVNVKHVVIPDLPEREAHNALWAEWTSHKSDFDIFVKVDADTVLAHRDVLAEVWNLFEQDPELTGVQAPLWDRFTDAPINGLNCFSPVVQFSASPDLCCDRVDSGHKHRIFASDCPSALKPAGHHCFHATDLQAFHFGLHRYLKGQLDILARVRDKWLENGDTLRAFVLAGERAGRSGKFNARVHNYTDSQLQLAYRLAREEIASNENRVDVR